jgi:flagellar motility protein MotE (MotC chaperone)
VKTGYDQFFKKVQKNSPKPKPVSLKRETSATSAEDLKKLVQQRSQILARNKRRRLNRQFPVSAAMTLMVFLSLGIFGFYQQDKVIEALDSIEIKVFGAASASDAAPKKAAKEDSSHTANKEKSADAKVEGDKKAEAAPSGLSEEELSLFKGLHERSIALDQREAELKKMEEELQRQREALEKRLSEIDGVRRNIASQLEEKVKVDKERVEQLVQFYSTMKPQQAAKIIESLNEDLSVEVLVKMKKKNAADIMNLINSEKAQRLSERFAGYKLKTRTTASSKDVAP